jgi:septin family protein
VSVPLVLFEIIFKKWEISSHLADLKDLTHDVLYETYRTEKLSRTVRSDTK